MSEVTYRCGKCGSSELCVTVSATARVVQEGLFVETEIEGADHEWDGDSIMWCNQCSNAGTVSEFLTEDE